MTVPRSAPGGHERGFDSATGRVRAHSRRSRHAGGPLKPRRSLFSHYFSGNRPYAYRLERLGFYYREYRRLMAHGRAVLPEAMPELAYWAPVDDQERESPRLIEFCGLRWDARCLAFHETERAVRAASLATRSPDSESPLDFICLPDGLLCNAGRLHQHGYQLQSFGYLYEKLG